MIISTKTMSYTFKTTVMHTYHNTFYTQITGPPSWMCRHIGLRMTSLVFFELFIISPFIWCPYCRSGSKITSPSFCMCRHVGFRMTSYIKPCIAIQIERVYKISAQSVENASKLSCKIDPIKYAYLHSYIHCKLNKSL
jgi:hypothetical protein